MNSLKGRAQQTIHSIQQTKEMKRKEPPTEEMKLVGYRPEANLPQPHSLRNPSWLALFGVFAFSFISLKKRLAAASIQQ